MGKSTNPADASKAMSDGSMPYQGRAVGIHRGRMRVGKLAVYILVVAIFIVVAVPLFLVIKNSDQETTFEGSDCASYRLPDGAVIIQAGPDPHRKTIAMEYTLPRGGTGQLTVPYDVQPATCVDEQIQGVVSIVHETDQKTRASTCTFIGDVLAGRKRLPPDRVKHFDFAFAREYHRASCQGSPK